LHFGYRHNLPQLSKAQRTKSGCTLYYGAQFFCQRSQRENRTCSEENQYDYGPRSHTKDKLAHRYRWRTFVTQVRYQQPCEHVEDQRCDADDYHIAHPIVVGLIGAVSI
jgi:hypothetical protein